MSNYWNQTPFIRLLLPFITGILAAIFLRQSIPYLAFVIGILFVGQLVLLSKWSPSFYKYRWLNGILINTMLVLIGYEITIINTEDLSPDHLKNINVRIKVAEIELTDMLTETDKSYKTIADIRKIFVGNNSKSVTGKVIVYFKKDSLAKMLKYGDVLLVSSEFTEIISPQNPDEFNYRRYLSFRNIYHQTYLYSDKWEYLYNKQGNLLIRISYSIREYLLSIIRNHVQSKDEMAIASSLLLGYREEISPELFNAFSRTGTIHVLSVSGLHVGLIYLVLNAFLSFFIRKKSGKIINPVVLISTIWLYVLITGLAPSACRAGTMITLVILAANFNRYTNIYNTLAVSAFLLLCINPFWIMDVGFQLSYLAVTGIVYIYPKIYRLYNPSNWILDKAWAITCVSISAQIATFPLGFLYFNQFPVYFLLSNLIIIPLTTFILYCGILLLFVSKITIIAQVTGYMLNYLLLGLNNTVLFFETLPFSLIQGITLTIFEMAIIYLIIISCFACLALKKIQFLKYALILGIFLSFTNIAEAYKQQVQRKFIIYNIRGASVYNFTCGDQSMLIGNKEILEDKQKLAFHIQGNLNNTGIQHQQEIDIAYISNITTSQFVIVPDLKLFNNFIQFHNTRFYIPGNDSKKLTITEKKIKVDYVIISGNVKVKIKELLMFVDPKTIIIDSSNSNSSIKKREKECKELNISPVVIQKTGAYEITV